MKLNLIHGLLASALLSFTAEAFSEASDSKNCFEKKDKVCLETISEKPSTDYTPEEFDAVYFLGLLHMNDKEYKAAKSQFKWGSSLGDKVRNIEKMTELFKGRHIEFSVDDCHAIRLGVTVDMDLYSMAEECYLSAAKNRPKTAKSAYYSTAAMYKDADPTRAEQYLIKAAELRHMTSICLLELAYTEFEAGERKPLVAFILDLEKDSEKASYWGEKCAFKNIK